MKEPSEKRKRTLALHERAIRFSNGVNISCPQEFSNVPSKHVWNLGRLDNFHATSERDLESEAGQLAAIFSAIIRNMRFRLEEERKFSNRVTKKSG